MHGSVTTGRIVTLPVTQQRSHHDHQHQSGNIQEAADGIFRINTPVSIPGAGQFSFNQYLIG
jgi:hypothetical protein